MPLYSETFGQRRPKAIVFLHGLLGSGQDWLKVVHTLSQNYFCLTIDLPGHGGSKGIQATDFSQVNQLIGDTLAYRQISDYVLVGYSLGARLAMYHACHAKPDQEKALHGLVLEGGHFGLAEQECAARLDKDQRWAQRFSSEPIGEVLTDWYQQAVFSSLDNDQRQSLIAKRSANLGGGIANMLMATSLAKQPQLLAKLEALSLPLLYVCGEQDKKFQRLVEGTAVPYRVIPSAGHNVHIEQPEAFDMAVTHFIKQLD